MAADDKDLLEQLDRHLSSPNQAWLFGAGISKEAGVPLMIPLTSRVLNSVAAPHKAVLEAVFAELPEKAHIEHLLSHLGDYAALAHRAKADKVSIGGKDITLVALLDAHTEAVTLIAETLRWGYRPGSGGAPEEVGEFGKSLVSIDGHKEFVQALFKTAQAGLQDRRGPVRLFSTNYDTLLEDALALSSVQYWDGFAGGAVAFRNYHFGDKDPGVGYRAHVVKLHGSIDWHLDDDGRVWRVREGDGYPTKKTHVLIYPQATKYVATQRDPFAAQFDLFRRALSTTADNVFAVCGYSFGDDHINQEIELVMASADNRTTMLVFCSDVPPPIEHWRTASWSKRLYLVTEKGLYVGQEGPGCQPKAGEKHDWWTFAGVAKLLKDGAEAYS